MRTIKFRGKRTDGQDWVYGYPIEKFQEIDGEPRIVIDTCRTFANDGYHSLEQYEVIPESVGQWTGLVDMDMVEAYEKDVVDVYFRDGEVERAVLIWDANRFKYQLKSSDGSLWGFNDTLRVKIIGNLIDSPELMEVE